VEFAAELEASLKEFSASGFVEVRENGGRAAPLEGLSSGAPAKSPCFTSGRNATT
jgi:hypothetical protein